MPYRRFVRVEHVGEPNIEWIVEPVLAAGYEYRATPIEQSFTNVINDRLDRIKASVYPKRSKKRITPYQYWRLLTDKKGV